MNALICAPSFLLILYEGNELIYDDGGSVPFFFSLIIVR